MWPFVFVELVSCDVLQCSRASLTLWSFRPVGEDSEQKTARVDVRRVAVALEQ